jgi:hypothetical protein
MLLRYGKYLSGSMVFIIILSLFFIGFLKHKTFLRKDSIRHDMSSYYAYLPALVIHKDPYLLFVKTDSLNHFGWVSQSKNGPILRMTMGTAILNLPFFLLADGITLITAEIRDGFSYWYMLFVHIAPVIYVSLGLLLLFLLLKQFYSEIASFISIFSIGFTSNLYYYTIHEGLMSHAYNFFLFSCVLSLLFLIQKKPNYKHFILLGLCFGLISLIRPTNSLICLVLIIFNPFSSRISFKITSKKVMQLFLVALSGFVMIIPQLLYWKTLSGQWVYYSYGDEGFFWLQPEVLKGLFSYRKGWLVYSPVMFLIIPGLYFIFRQNRVLFVNLIIILIIHVYVVFSWWCWWYGGSFGSRPMIDVYPFLSLPLAAFANFLIQQKTLKYLYLASLFFLIHLNLSQTRLYRVAIIHWDSMSKVLYWKLFLKGEVPEDYEKLLDPPDYESAIEGNNR